MAILPLRHLLPFITPYLNMFPQFPSFDHHLLQYRNTSNSKVMETLTNRKHRKGRLGHLAHMEAS